MAIFVKRVGAGVFHCVSGNAQLLAELATKGAATVVDLETSERLMVHVCEGKVVVLSGDGGIAETLAAAAVAKAANTSIEPEWSEVETISRAMIAKASERH